MNIRILGGCLRVFSWGAVLVLTGSVLVLLGYLLVKGVPSLGRDLIFGQVDVLDAVLLKKRVFDGLFPAIAGTLSVVVLSVGLAIPVGVCAGIYMSEFATVFQQRVFGLMFDILAGIPSIVIGLFGQWVDIYGKTLSKPDLRRKVGMVFQTPNPLPMFIFI